MMIITRWEMPLQDIIDRCHRINDGPLKDSGILGDVFRLLERDVPETTNQGCESFRMALSLTGRWIFSNEIFVDLRFESIEIIVQGQKELLVEFRLFDPSLQI